MFLDEKLRTHFNENDDAKFITRLLHIAKKDATLKQLSILESAVSDDCKDFVVDNLNRFLDYRKGKVYIANNILHPTLLKIGRTAKSIEMRENSLNSAGVVGKIQILWHIESCDATLAETYIHKRLNEYSVEKEFFNISYEDATILIEQCISDVQSFYGRIVDFYQIVSP